VGSVLFPVFRDQVHAGDAEKAWRTVCVFPASLALLCGLVVAFISDDAPCGNYSKMRQMGTMDRILFTTSLRSGAKRNTWILYVQYACCFGVEIVMNNASVLYFTSEYGLTTETASFLGFAFGSLNLFARGVGGWCSDQLNVKYGMRGRLWIVTMLLILQGATIIAFSFCTTLGTSIATMCIFSLFVQSVEGAIFGVVPYVSKLFFGSVSGFVGAGGNVGSVVFALGFRSLNYNTAFLLMGALVMASSILSVFIDIPCHACMLWGKDNHAVITARQRFQSRRMRENLESSARRMSTMPGSHTDVELNAASVRASENASISHGELSTENLSPRHMDDENEECLEHLESK
jgi:NNP family nitrate/nitrite transporter-like MFS transporter